MENVVVVGGAGFVGSHTCKALANAGIRPVVYDNLSTGHAENVKWGPLVAGDLKDTSALKRLFDECRPTAVMHFAASAYVGESLSDPAKYYQNNVAGTLSLLEAMLSSGVSSLVFSSSCAVYGVPDSVPITESTSLNPINPYGWTKRIVEQILSDYEMPLGLSSISLRYFNAAGADLDGDLHERHSPEPHLIPRALLAAAGRLDRLEIFGDDYDTADGTCVRDYVHVTDLAEAHLAALHYVIANQGCRRFNLGSGVGTSIRQIIAAVSEFTGRPVPHVVLPRRGGDPPVLVADSSAARRQLGFEPRFSNLEVIIRSAWPSFASPIQQSAASAEAHV